MALEFAVILALILLNGVFSLSEMAIVASRKARLRHEAEQGKKNYRLALETAEKPSHFLSTIQVVMTLVGTLAGAFGGATVARSLEAALAPIDIIGSYAGPISVGIVVLCTTFVSVVFGELVPKSLALARPEPIAAAMIGPLRVIIMVFRPISRLLSATTDFVVSLLGARGTKEPSVTEEEVRILIAQGAEAGIFEDREREMFEGVLSLGDRRVTSLMTPRTDVVYLNLRDSDEDARTMIIGNSRYGYLPAVDGDLDHVVGMVPVKASLAAIATGTFAAARDFMLRPVLVPESFSALGTISALSEGEVKTALILDEYGGVAGLVALADLMGSVIGDMPLTGDEDEPTIIRRDDGSYLVDGSMPIDRFVGELALDESLGEGRYDTLAGLVLDRMGTIPHAGDKCRWDGCVLEIMDMDGNRIDKVLVTLMHEKGD
jgi:putative hemolysin